MSKKRKKRLKIIDVAGNVGINRSPLRRAIQSINRSAEASKTVRGMAKKRSQ